MHNPNFVQEKHTQLFNELGVFFAFSTKQFDEASQPDIEYVQSPHIQGMFYPREQHTKLHTRLSDIIDEGIQHDLNHLSKEQIIRDALANHETGYTYDCTDAAASVEHYGITFDEVQTQFNKQVAEGYYDDC